MYLDKSRLEDSVEDLNKDLLETLGILVPKLAALAFTGGPRSGRKFELRLRIPSVGVVEESFESWTPGPGLLDLCSWLSCFRHLARLF